MPKTRNITAIVHVTPRNVFTLVDINTVYTHIYTNRKIILGAHPVLLECPLHTHTHTHKYTILI